MKWERIEPDEPCDSPDGHSMTDLMTFGSKIPARLLCSRCGRQGAIVVFADEPQA